MSKMGNEFVRQREAGIEFPSLKSLEPTPEWALNVERKCSRCNWKGTQRECGFGHDDFYCPNCGREALTTEAMKCPNCGTKLEYFSGLEQIPAYLFCPKCNDCAYDEGGRQIFQLV